MKLDPLNIHQSAIGRKDVLIQLTTTNGKLMPQRALNKASRLHNGADGKLYIGSWRYWRSAKRGEHAETEILFAMASRQF